MTTLAPRLTGLGLAAGACLLAACATDDTPDRELAAPTGDALIVPFAPLDGQSWPTFRGVNDTCGHHVVPHGGRVIGAPLVHRLFWNGGWVPRGTTVGSTAIDTTWTTLTNMPALYTRLGEYGITPGHPGSRQDLLGAPTGAVAESVIQAQLSQRLLAVFGTSSGPTANDVFVIFLAPDTTSVVDTSGHFHGHHGNMTWRGFDVVYAVIESGDTDTVNTTTSHELSEALTDPDATVGTLAWREDGGTTEGEVGDLCNGYRHKLAGVTLEGVYSQQACRCVRERELNNVDMFWNGSADPTIFNDGKFYPEYLGSVFQLGRAGDLPVPGDYDGDGSSELTVFDARAGKFTVFNIMDWTFTDYALGQVGDLPVPGDYDGDGKTDVAVFRDSDGTWRIRNSSPGVLTVEAFGAPDDLPVPADYDNDGKTDLAVRRASDASWYVKPSATGAMVHVFDAAGSNDNTAMPGDFDGDGSADLLSWDRLTGKLSWVALIGGEIHHISSIFTFDEVPVARDYDLDWRTDPATWNPNDGVWRIHASAGGVFRRSWGGGRDDIPVQQSYQERL